MSDPLLPPAVSAYLRKRSASSSWQIHERPDRSFSGAVVIPSLAETANLSQTLQSLSLNPADLLSSFMILVVVNNRADAADADMADNLESLALLPKWKQRYGLQNLFWVDAASAGRELPLRQGVGLARKIGMDLTLRHLDYSCSDPVLVCLDADTIVQPDYLPAIARHFDAAAAGGASIPYRHRPAATPAGQAAIERYELFLRAYVLGLERAGSPYAFHTVGSAMACRASAYIAAGGMNRRLAGEDFYFLQQIFKIAGVATLSGTTVYPSPRSSHRVPFGTGRAVGDMLAKGGERLLFYQPIVFAIVGDWLAYVAEHREADAALLLNGAGRISPVLHEFLEQAGFGASWDNLKNNCRDGTRLLTAFHGWFDAFRTMRLVHQLSDRYPRIGPEEAVPPLLEIGGPVNVAEMLEQLRKLQGAG